MYPTILYIPGGGIVREDERERVDVTAVFPAKAVSISSPANAPQAELRLGNT
jgi:hypothetical protein